MVKYVIFLCILFSKTIFAGLPPQAKYVDVWVKDQKSADYPSWQMYPLKQKYAIACAVIDTNLEDHQIKFPQFNSPLFAMMVPCLKLNYKLSKESVSYPEQDKLIKDFKHWLQTCAEENLIDIIDVANTLNLTAPCKLAAAMLDKKIRHTLRKNVYSQEDIEYLKLRPFSFAKQFLPNLRKPKLNAKPIIEPEIEDIPKDLPKTPVNWLAWLKSFFVKQNDTLPINLNKELICYKASPFKLKKEPDSWVRKIKALLVIIFFK